MKVLFATGECAPFLKTGGLGDVANALPAALAKEKDIDDVVVVMPYYKKIKENPKCKMEFVKCFTLPLSWRREYCGVFKLIDPKSKVTHYFIDNEKYFYRDKAYGDFDDGERFAYFSKAVLEMIIELEMDIDIVHCNDWQTAFIPLMIKAQYNQHPRTQNLKTIITIHNIEYQGKASNSFLTDVLGLSEQWRDVATHFGCINALKSAIMLADKISTVSRTYSFEIRHAYFAHNLENVLQMNAYKIWGIVNGLDTKLYDPKTDKALAVNFGPESIAKKAENKAVLQKRFGLPVNPDIPIVAMVSRLVGHKGFDLIEFVSNELMDQNLQLVVLGTGDTKYEELFYRMQYYRPDKVAVKIDFDPALASMIYGGADFLLMPSKSEPCGLTQLMAMRYGTIPIVRETGGLFDTVPSLNVETLEGRGFTFKLYNAHDMLGAVKRAVDFYNDKDKLKKVIKSDMQYDSSWANSITQYIDMYKSTLG